MINIEALKSQGCELWWPGTVGSANAPKSITAYGNVAQTNAIADPWGGTRNVAYFDGTGDYLTVGSVSDFNFLHQTTGKWSISYLIRFQNVYDSSIYAILSTILTTTIDSGIRHTIREGGKLQLEIYRSVTGTRVLSGVTSNSIPNDQEWHYIVITYDYALSTQTAKMYCDGSLLGTLDKIASNTPSIANAKAPLFIGADINGTGTFGEYLSEMVFINGECIDGTIVPTTPFKPDPYTKLLLHMDGVGAAFYDSSDPPGDNGFPILPAGVTITPNGTFTSIKGKDGRSYYKFDGSTNYITISDHAIWSMFLNNFTICGWINFTTIAANRMIIGQYANANNYWMLQWTTENTITLTGKISGTATFNYSCPLTPVAGTWYYITVERLGSDCIIYINNINQTVTIITAFTEVATNIASTLNIGGLNSIYNLGNIKDLQIFTKALTQDQIGSLMTETYIY